MEIHLDLVGGLAGDMFIAAMLDAFPEQETRVIQAIRQLNVDSLECALHPHIDHVLRGRRFHVEAPPSRVDRVPFAASQLTHHHASWKSIRARLRESSLSAGTLSHALDIFALLAEAEGFVHGIDPDAVEFHEVGAWDSIADIVGAATLIDAVGATRWTASPAPLGSGRVRTAHGMLPVPAPATARLLLGMPTLDDGVGGERVTPTGAAILRHVCPPVASANTGAAAVRTLVATGTGFGTRKLPGLSNHLRVLCFEPSEVSSGGHRRMHVVEFEVDDQSGEDLAMGLDRLRMHPAVLDVTQAPVFGKKGRIMVHVRVLAREFHLDEVVEACFRETTTIGLRHRTVQGVGLTRRFEAVDVDGHRLRVKVVDRPGGPTAKAESDDAMAHADHARRASVRARAEALALDAKQEIDA